jgi:hypothetical protein
MNHLLCKFLQHVSVLTCYSYRDLVNNQVDLEKQEHVYDESKKQSWGSWAYGWFGSEKTEEEKKKEEEEQNALELNEDQREHLYNTIGYTATEQFEKAGEIPKEYFEYKLNFHLKGASIVIVDNEIDKKAIMKANIYDILGDAAMRPDQSFSVHTALGDISLTDEYNDNTAFKDIITRRLSKEMKKEKEEGNHFALVTEAPLLKISFETKPIDEQADLRIKVLLDRFDIVVNSDMIQKVMSFFVVPSFIDLKLFKKQVKRMATAVTRQAQDELKRILEEKWTMDINFEIQAPSVIFPERTNDEETGILLLNLGQLHLRSNLEGVKERKERLASGETVDENDYYDHFKLDIDDVQALQTSNTDYRQALEETAEKLSTEGEGENYLSQAIEDKAHHLLEKVSIRVNIAQSLILNSPELAVTKLDAHMKKVKANISATKLARLVPIINSVIQLMDNPTGVETKKLKMKGRLKVVRAPPLPELTAEGEKEQKVTFARKDKSNEEYYAELLDGGTLNLYDVREEQKDRRQRRPIASINTVAFRAEIFDHNHNFGMRTFVRDLAKKLIHIDIEDGKVWDDKGASTEERNGLPGIHLEDNQFAIALPQSDNSLVSLVFETDDKMSWLLSLHDGVMAYIYYEFSSISDVIDVRYGTRKSKDNKTSDTLAQEADELNEKRVLLQALFKLEELLVTIDYRPGYMKQKEGDSQKEVPLLDIACTNFVLGLITRSYDITVDTKLEGFNILDMTAVPDRKSIQDNTLIRTVLSSVNPKDFSTYADILTSGVTADRDLVTLSFIMLTDFRSELTDEVNAKMAIKLKMQQLYFVTEQVILAHMVDLGLDINENVLKELAGRTAHFSSQALIIRTGAELERPQFSVDASLEKATILFNDLGFNFLQFSMSAVHVWASIGQETTGMSRVGGTLGNIKVKQYELGQEHESILYKNILGIYKEGAQEERDNDDDDLEQSSDEKPLIDFDFEYKKIEKGVPLDKQGADDDTLVAAEPVKLNKQNVNKATVKVAMRSLKLVYLHRVTYKVMTYFTNGPLLQSISGTDRDSAVQAVQEQTKKSSQQSEQAKKDEEVLPQKLLIDVDVHIENPHILIPVSRLSEEAIIIDLGYISISNKLTDVGNKGMKFREEYSIQVSKLNIVTVLDQQRQSVRHGKPIKILDDLDIDLSAKRSVVILSEDEQEKVLKDIEEKEEKEAQLSVKEFGLTDDIDNEEEDQESLTMVVPEVNLNITHQQYEIFLEVLGRNIGDIEDINPWAKEIEEEKKQQKPPKGVTYTKKDDEDEESDDTKEPLTIEEHEEQKQRKQAAQKKDHIEQLEKEKEQEEAEENKRKRKKAAGSAFKIHLSFPKLNIKLLRGAGYDIDWENEDPLVSLNLKELNAMIIPGGAVNRTARISVTLSTIEAHDLRNESQSVFKTFIDSDHEYNTKNAEKQDFIRVMLDLMGAGTREHVSSEIVARLEMGNPHFVLDPDVIFAVKDFFMERGDLAKELGERHETDIQEWHAKMQERFVPLAAQTDSQGDIVIDRDMKLTSDLVLTDETRLVVKSTDKKEIIIDGDKYTIDILANKDSNEPVNDTMIIPRIYLDPGVTLVLKNVKVRFDANVFHYLVDRGDGKSFIETPVTGGVLFENVVLKAKAEEEMQRKIAESVEEIAPIMILNIEASFGRPTISIPVNAADKQTSQLAISIGAGLNIQTRENGYELYQAELREFEILMVHAKQVIDPELERQLRTEYTNKRARKDTQALLERFHVIASMETPKHDIREKHVYKNILVNIIESLQVQVSYRDIKLINQIVTIFTSKMSQGVKDQNIPVAPVKDEPTKQDDSSPALAVARTADSHVYEETVTTYNMDIKCTDNMVRLLFVDDINGYDIPLLDVIVNRVALSNSCAVMGVLNKTQVVNEITVNLALYIAAHYYNMRVADWEPVIEPFGLILAYEKKPATQAVEELTVPLPVEFTTVEHEEPLGPRITTTTLRQPAISQTRNIDGVTQYTSTNMPTNSVQATVPVSATDVPNADETVSQGETTKEQETKIVSAKIPAPPHKIFVGTLEGYDVMNINVSQEMLRSILTSVNLWREDLSGRAQILQELDLYTVYNHSGTPIEFTLQETSKTNEKSLELEPTIIPAGGEFGFNPSNYYAVDAPELGGGSTAETVLLLRLTDSQQQTRLVLNKSTRSRGYSLFPTEYGPLHITIEFEQGRGIITIKSPLTIRNQCTMPCEIGNVIARDRSINVMGVLEPGQTIGIPIQMIQDMMLIRPISKDKEYQWEILLNDNDPEGLNFLNLMRKPTETRFISNISADNTSALYAILQPKVAEQRGWEMYDFDLQQMTTEQMLTQCSCCIEIRPPISIENLLGMDMGYYMFRFDSISNIYRQIDSGELRRGDTAYNYGVNLYQDEIRVKLCKLQDMRPNMQLRVDELAQIHAPYALAKMAGNIDETKLSSFISINESQARHDTYVIDREGHESFKVHFDYTESGVRSQRHVVLFSPYWILNHTQQPLYVKEHKKDTKNVIKKFFERRKKPVATYLPPSDWVENEEMLQRQETEDILTGDENELVTEGGAFRQTPIMFSFSDGTDAGNQNPDKRICIQVDGSNDSSPIGIDVLNVPQTTCCENSQTLFPVGVYTNMAPGRYKRTKIVTFSSRYRVHNGTEKQMELILESSKERIAYMPGQSTAFYLPNNGKTSKLDAVKVYIGIGDPILDPENYVISAMACPINRLGLTEMKMIQPPSGDMSWMFTKLDALDKIPLVVKKFLHINVEEVEGCLVMSFTTPETSSAPYRIDNDLDQDVLISQPGTHRWWLVNAHSSLPWTWDDPSLLKPINRKNDAMNPETAGQIEELLINLDPINSMMTPIKVNMTEVNPIKNVRMQNLKVAYFVVMWQGTTRVLRLAHNLNDLSLTSPRSVTEAYQRGELDQNIPLEKQELIVREEEALIERQQVDLFNMSVLVDIAAIGISFIDNAKLVREYGREFDSFLPREVFYLYIEGLYVQLDTTTKNQFVDVMIQHMQIDNTFHSAAFPVLLTNTDELYDEPFIKIALCRSAVTNRVNTATAAFEEIQNDSSAQDDDKHSISRLSEAAIKERANENDSETTSVLQEQLEEQPHLEMDQSIQIFPYVYITMQDATLQLDYKFIESVVSIATDLMGIMNNKPEPISTKSSSSMHTTGVNRALMHIDTENKVDEMMLHPVEKQAMANIASNEAPAPITSAPVTSTPLPQDEITDDQMSTVSTAVTKANTTATTTATGTVSSVATKMYFDRFSLSDINIHTTFNFDRTENPRLSDSAIFRFLEALGMTLVNVDDAPLSLSGIEFEHEIMTTTDIQNRLQKHFTKQGLLELYKVLGSLNIIGNPLGVFNDIKSGFHSMVSKPKKTTRSTTGESSIESEIGRTHAYHHHHKGNVGQGVSKGSKHFFRETIHGAFRAASRISYSIGRGISYLTLDRDFARRKEREMLINKPSNTKEGMSDASDVLFGGVAEGIKGVVEEPRKAMQDGSTFDVIKGVGRGVIGLPLKPIAGIVDSATKVTEGIASGFEKKEDVIRKRRRVRYPRTFREDGAVTVYDYELALSQYYLYAVNDKQVGWREQQARLGGGGLLNRGVDHNVTAYAEHERALGFLRNKKDTDIYLLTNLSVIKIRLANEQERWRIGLDTILELNYNEPFQVITIDYTPTTGDNQIIKKLTTDDEKAMTRFWTKLNGAIAEVVRKKKEAYEEAKERTVAKTVTQAPTTAQEYNAVHVE